MEGNLIDPLEAAHILKFHYNLLDNSTSESGKGLHGAIASQSAPSSPSPEMTTPSSSSPASENPAKIKQKKRPLKTKDSTVTTSTQRRKLSIGNLFHHPSAQLNPANPINSIFKKQRAERERAHPIQSTASQSKPSAQLNPANPINPINPIFKKQREEWERAHSTQSTANQSKSSHSVDETQDYVVPETASYFLEPLITEDISKTKVAKTVSKERMILTRVFSPSS